MNSTSMLVGAAAGAVILTACGKPKPAAAAAAPAAAPAAEPSTTLAPGAMVKAKRGSSLLTDFNLKVPGVHSPPCSAGSCGRHGFAFCAPLRVLRTPRVLRAPVAVRLRVAREGL